MKTTQEIHPYLPLTEVTYFILISLAPGPSHGYAIMKDVRQMSQGRVTLSTGTLYGALKRLLELEWISRNGDQSKRTPGRVRKAYRLTLLGRQVLQAELQRLDTLVAAAHQRAVNDTSRG